MTSLSLDQPSPFIVPNDYYNNNSGAEIKAAKAKAKMWFRINLYFLRITNMYNK